MKYEDGLKKNTVVVFLNLFQKKVHKMSVLDFVKWTFSPDNRAFLKNSSPTEISDFYERLTGTLISPTRVSYNRSRWIRIKDRIYERKALPLEMFSQRFKAFARENGIEIDYGYSV